MAESPLLEWLEQLSDDDLELMARDDPARFRSLYSSLYGLRAGDNSSMSGVRRMLGGDHLEAQLDRLRQLADRLDDAVAHLRSSRYVEVTAKLHPGDGKVYTLAFRRVTNVVPPVVLHFLVDDEGDAGLVAYRSDDRGLIDTPARRFELGVRSFDAVPEALVGTFTARL